MGSRLSISARLRRHPANLDASATVTTAATTIAKTANETGPDATTASAEAYANTNTRQDTCLPAIIPVPSPSYLEADPGTSSSTPALAPPLLPVTGTVTMGNTTAHPVFEDLPRCTREEAPATEQNPTPANTHANREATTVPPLVSLFPSQTAMPAPTPSDLPPVTCSVCCDTFPGRLHGFKFLSVCTCRAVYCTKCLRELFLRASADLSCMPPRCCFQRFPLHMARPYLTDDEAAKFRARYEEWSTPKPFYCPVPTCSALISKGVWRKARDAGKSKGRIDSVVGAPTSQSIKCPTCLTSICTDCRELAHSGSACSQSEFGVDNATAQLLKLWGYKRCPNCGNGVRKMYGCAHMACRCGAHWCWTCLSMSCGGCQEYDDSESDADESTAMPTNEPPHDFTNSSDNAAPTPAQNSLSYENLDDKPLTHWENIGADFGDEPYEDDLDNEVDCHHTFTPDRVPMHKLPLAQMECSSCWNPVHPEIELPGKVDRKLRRRGERMVAPNDQARSRRNRENGKRVTRGTSFRGEQDSTPPHRRSRSCERRCAMASQPMMPLNLVSDNKDRVVDTYGNTVSSNDFILYRGPRRRHSFHFTPESTVTSDEEAPAPFSLALQCMHCEMIVCSACKEEMA